MSRKTPAAKARTKSKKSKKGETRISTLLDKAMSDFEKRLNKNEIQPTLGEYLKLVQIEKEMNETEPKEITVTWVEPEAESKD